MSDILEPTPHLHGSPPEAATPQAVLDHKELSAEAFQRTRMPMVVTDPRQTDNPVVMANPAFLNLTGYGAEEVVGRNCRFLQGPDTAPTAVAEIRAAVANHSVISWGHINLLGEYDFSDEKLRDSVGIPPQKIVPKLQAKMRGRKLG